MNLTDKLPSRWAILGAVVVGSAIVTVLWLAEGSVPFVSDTHAALLQYGLGGSLAGWIAAGKIADLLPDPDGIFLISFRADEPGGEIWEVSEDVFADLKVVGGSLYQWEESPKRVYEVRDYHPEENVAVANWRESAPASRLAEPPTVEDAMAAIRELREDLEPDVAKARELQRRIRGIVRRLDRERAEAQRSILDDHVAPDLGDSTTISDVIDDSLPDDLHPEVTDHGVDTDDGPTETSVDDLLDALDEDDEEDENDV